MQWNANADVGLGHRARNASVLRAVVWVGTPKSGPAWARCFFCIGRQVQLIASRGAKPGLHTARSRYGCRIIGTLQPSAMVCPIAMPLLCVVAGVARVRCPGGEVSAARGQSCHYNVGGMGDLRDHAPGLKPSRLTSIVIPCVAPRSAPRYSDKGNAARVLYWLRVGPGN